MKLGRVNIRAKGSGASFGEVETWYDRRSRNWVTQRFDEDGDQIGNAGYSGNRAGAELEPELAVREMTATAEAQFRGGFA